MRATTARLVTPAFALVLAVAVAGCSPRPPASTGTPQITTVPTTAVTPTGTEVPAQPVESTGPITTPKSGSAERASMLVVLRSGLGLTGTIGVNQLFVQGTAAVGDASTSDKRLFFALTGGPGSWKVAWSAAAGSKSATVEDLLASAPEVSADLAGKLDFAKVVAKTPSKKAASSPTPTLASFRSFALAQAKSYAGASFTGTFTVEARIAKDSSGTWWGNAIATPADQSLESIGVWGRYAGGMWQGEIADFSDENADAGYFPADVLARLSF